MSMREDDLELALRPRTRGECQGSHRPCPWISCRHHLYLDVNPSTGALKINFPGVEVEDLEHSCSLDVADQGEHTLKEVGEIVSLTRERIRQIECLGLRLLRKVTLEDD